MTQTESKTIVVAGASGFVGNSLPDLLGAEYRLIGLSRDLKQAAQRLEAGPSYEWRQADLFSRRQTIEALRGADMAVYLVHSMRPSASLTQGDVRDMDLICADNFARAAHHNGVKHIVYVSGLIPKSDELSEYLTTRLEVEKTLGNYGSTVTTLRAGIVIGAGGDLTEMIFRLVEKLPAMLLPKWTRQEVRPITRDDLVDLIRIVLQDHSYAGRSWDVAGPDAVTYAQILEMSAELMGLERKIYHAPVFTPRLSTAWIAFFAKMPRNLVRPMVEMLQQTALPANTDLQDQVGQASTSLRTALREAVEKRGTKSTELLATDDSLGSEMITVEEPNEVRSVQRLPIPQGRRARWVATTYAEWLPQFMRPFMRVTFREEQFLEFGIRFTPWPLLILELDHHVSEPDRQLYWIRGGLLAKKEQAGARLEFREVLGGQWSLAAIHEFRPRLPWLIYIWTQAKIHLFVMNAYGRYLAKISRTEVLQEEDKEVRALPTPEIHEDNKVGG